MPRTFFISAPLAPSHCHCEGAPQGHLLRGASRPWQSVSRARRRGTPKPPSAREVSKPLVLTEGETHRAAVSLRDQSADWSWQSASSVPTPGGCFQRGRATRRPKAVGKDDSVKETHQEFLSRSVRKPILLCKIVSRTRRACSEGNRNPFPLEWRFWVLLSLLTKVTRRRQREGRERKATGRDTPRPLVPLAPPRSPHRARPTASTGANNPKNTALRHRRRAASFGEIPLFIVSSRFFHFFIKCFQVFSCIFQEKCKVFHPVYRLSARRSANLCFYCFRASVFS